MLQSIGRFEIYEECFVYSLIIGFIFPYPPHGAVDLPKEEDFIEAEEEQVFLSRIHKKLKAAESGDKSDLSSGIKELADSVSPDDTLLDAW